MKKFALLLAAVLAVTVWVVPAKAAISLAVLDLVDDFNRPDADRDLSGGETSVGGTVWWMNWDEGTSIVDDTLKMEGATHFGTGVNTSTSHKFIVLRVKGDATGVILAPGGEQKKFEDLVGYDGKALPALTKDWQNWIVDIDASGLKRDQGFHLNIGGGTLYVDEIYYADVEGASSELETLTPEVPVVFPEKALVDDFDRPADEANNSGGVNSAGLDTWWYNVYDYVIEDGALVVTFDADHAHFGMGANVPSEAEYPYLVLRVKGVAGGDYSGLLLNLGASNPVLFSDMVDQNGKPLPKIGTEWVDLVIDMKASGIVFDQGFHMNSDTVGTLYIDEIYYTSKVPTLRDVAGGASGGEAKANPGTGDAELPIYALTATIAAAGMALLLKKKAKNN